MSLEQQQPQQQPQLLSRLFSYLSVAVNRFSNKVEYARNDSNWSDVFLCQVLSLLVEEAIAVDDVQYHEKRRVCSTSSLLRHDENYVLPSLRVFCRLSGVCSVLRRVCDAHLLHRFRMVFVGISRHMTRCSSVTGSVFPILLWYAFAPQFVKLLRARSSRATRLYWSKIAARVGLPLSSVLDMSEEELRQELSNRHLVAPYCFHLVPSTVWCKGWRHVAGMMCTFGCFSLRQTLIQPADVHIAMRFCSNVHINTEMKLLWLELERMTKISSSSSSYKKSVL
jgi:hypothetical protein